MIPRPSSAHAPADDVHHVKIARGIGFGGHQQLGAAAEIDNGDTEAQSLTPLRAPLQQAEVADKRRPPGRGDTEVPFVVAQLIQLQQEEVTAGGMPESLKPAIYQVQDRPPEVVHKGPDSFQRLPRMM